MQKLSWIVLALGLSGIAGCGDGGGGGTDSGPPPMDAPRGDAQAMRCGNGMVEGTEECDDTNTTADDGCSPTCELECGDGRVGGTEDCDTGIAPGTTGACPTTCDDGDSCTTDSMDGADCNVTCSNGPITMNANGDGCCLPGAVWMDDNDCMPVCGNGMVETPPETCDTAIVTGPGACPTSCDDGIACTADALTGSMCTAACTNTPITMVGPTDGCCPTGGTPATDPDCGACGNGTVTPPETCDTAIPAGMMGACPTSCSDGDVCTTDTLVGGGGCMAACSFTPIAAGTMDMCCPMGATIGTDPDCMARCGDRVVTAPETCDDGNTTSGDGCSSTCMTEAAVMPTAFRFTDLDLRDPHIFARVILCVDATNTAFGMPGINPLLQDAITMDGDSPPDGELDLSIAQVFQPLVQTAGTSTPSYLAFPDCTAPMSSTSCTLPAGAMRLMAPAMNMGGTMPCLGTLPMTTRASYTPAIVTPTPPGGGTCFVANAGTVTFDLGGIPIQLTDAQIGGEWFGSPATEIRDGLLRGFLAETYANQTYIPDGLTGQASIDCQPLATLLPGGNPPPLMASDPGPPAPCPRPTDPPANCSGNDDRDMNGTVRGWYFYLNFTAARVTYTAL
jgi:cysteine-rich repeat protein